MALYSLGSTFIPFESQVDNFGDLSPISSFSSGEFHASAARLPTFLLENIFCIWRAQHTYTCRRRLGVWESNTSGSTAGRMSPALQSRKACDYGGSDNMQLLRKLIKGNASNWFSWDVCT